MSKDKEKKEEAKPVVARTLVDIQRIKLEKLMKNPEKAVIIPEKPKERGAPVVPDFVRNVMGSSAGAGSGEFHVYRHLRRKEYARQHYMNEKAKWEKLEDEYHGKLEENKRKAEEETAKKRSKRLKKKQNKKKAKGKKKVVSESESEELSEEENEDNESNIETENLEKLETSTEKTGELVNEKSNVEHMEDTEIVCDDEKRNEIVDEKSNVKATEDVCDVKETTELIKKEETVVIGNMKDKLEKDAEHMEDDKDVSDVEGTKGIIHEAVETTVEEKVEEQSPLEISEENQNKADQS